MLKDKRHVQMCADSLIVSFFIMHNGFSLHSRRSCITWGCLRCCSSCSRCCVASPWPRVTGRSVARGFQVKRRRAAMFLWSADCGWTRSETLWDTDNSGGGSQFCSCVLKSIVSLQIVRSWVICLLLRMLVDVLKRLSESETLVSSLWFRYFSAGSSGERESALSDSQAWLGHGIVDNPFLGLFGTRNQRGLRTSKGWWWVSIKSTSPTNPLHCYSSVYFLSCQSSDKQEEV